MIQNHRMKIFKDRQMFDVAFGQTPAVCFPSFPSLGLSLLCVTGSILSCFWWVEHVDRRPQQCVGLFDVIHYTKVITIAEHTHRGRWRRHRHSGLRHLSHEPKHSGTWLGPLIAVSHRFPHRQFVHSGIGLTECRTVGHLKDYKVERDTNCTSK